MNKLLKLLSTLKVNEEDPIDNNYIKLDIERFDALMSVIHYTDQFYVLRRTIDFGEELLDDEKLNKYQQKDIAKDLISALEVRAEIFCGNTKKI
mgnify:CR=1 FL=1